jgi:hypothetical protein
METKVKEFMKALDEKIESLLFPSGHTQTINKPLQPTPKRQYGKPPRNYECYNTDSIHYCPPEGLKIATDDQGQPIYW